LINAWEREEFGERVNIAEAWRRRRGAIGEPADMKHRDPGTGRALFVVPNHPVAGIAVE
jgi:hypothetical protein